MSIEYRSHTADLRMLITANTLEKLFEESLVGMSTVMRSNACENQSGPSKTRIIDIQATDVTNLLIDFLSEVLSLTYIDKILYCQIRLNKLSENQIMAEITGRPLDYLDEEIKAVTYHEAEVKQDEHDNWMVTIIFDI